MILALHAESLSRRALLIPLTSSSGQTYAPEKLLKALIASTGTEPPRVHDLAELAELATVDFPAAQVLTTQIEEITSWAVVTRYPSRGDTPLPTRHEIATMFPLITQLRAIVAAASGS